MDKGLWDVPQSAFPVQERVRVRFNEIDGQSIVFNANYLVYADIGVTEYFRRLSAGAAADPGAAYFKPFGTDMVVVNADIDYHASARGDDIITIAARAARFGRTSFALHCAIFRDDTRLTDILLTYVHVVLDSGAPRPLPAPFIHDCQRIDPGCAAAAGP